MARPIPRVPPVTKRHVAGQSIRLMRGTFSHSSAVPSER
jgi:hypothetical protein